MHRFHKQSVQSEIGKFNLWRERILAEFPEVDEQTLRDSLEGVSDLEDMVSEIVRSALLDQARARALELRITDMRDRLTRYRSTAARKKEFARDTMSGAEIRKIERSDFTVSLRRSPPAIVIADEGVIPEEFWTPQAPKLDKKRLGLELKAGRTIPGAILGEQTVSLAVRTK